jgi:transglutaminase-like putative cysteine protease
VQAGVAAYAAESFAPGRPLGEAAADLCRRIHDDFDYVSGSTTVRSTVTDLLSGGEGVCQDFAHLAVAGLRSRGLPARYVSGYLETLPPPGKAKLRGVDASHAWFSVWTGDGWLDLDPTNDRVVDEQFVVLAHGRDYGDVPPLKGVIFTDSAKSVMAVSVDMERVEAGWSTPPD